MDLELSYIKRPDGGRTLTIPEEQKTAAIAFLREGGAKPPAEIEALVQEGHEAVLRGIDGCSPAQASFRPDPDEWCVLDLMAHVVTGKQLVAMLCAALATGSLPPGFGEGNQDESAQDGVTISRFETLEAARTAADAAHQALLGFLRSPNGEPNLEMTFRHFVFGAFNCREWAAFQRLHDDNHWQQIASIRATPGFPES